MFYGVIFFLYKLSIKIVWLSIISKTIKSEATNSFWCSQAPTKNILPPPLISSSNQKKKKKCIWHILSLYLIVFIIFITTIPPILYFFELWTHIKCISGSIYTKVTALDSHSKSGSGQGRHPATLSVRCPSVLLMKNTGLIKHGF